MDHEEGSSLTEARQRIAAAYDPSTVEQAGKALTQLVVDYLAKAAQNPAPTLPWHAPQALIEVAGQSLDEPKTANPADRYRHLAEQALHHGIRLQSPHYIGHQVPPPVPIAGLFDAIGSVTNQVMGIYEMGPFGTAVERAVVARLGELIGWPKRGFDAVVTHGGSLANLTALLCARNVRFPESWSSGLASAASRPAIITSVDSHYSVARAAGIVGIGTDQVLKSGVDSNRQLCPDRLAERIVGARSDGYDVFAIVASAGATPTGAFDRLEEIAAVAAEHGCWLHVDAAHGGAALLSRKHRGLLTGIERADSITWDAHKMMFVPALCTFLFFRDAAHSYQTFQQDAPYLFDPSSPGLAAYDSAMRTVECTKRAAALGVWGVWSTFGPGLFEDLVDVTFDLARQFHALLRDADDFVSLNEPECNILCFRHVPPSLTGAQPSKVSDFQLALRRRLVESGDFYITSTKLDGVAALRVTIINPLTQPDHLRELLNAIRRHGAALLGDSEPT